MKVMTRQWMDTSMFSHPATMFYCRHCGGKAGHDPELCFYCGPVCPDCWMDEEPCPNVDEDTVPPDIAEIPSLGESAVSRTSDTISTLVAMDKLLSEKFGEEVEDDA